MRYQRVVTSHAGNFSKQIDIARRSGQREVQSRRQGLLVKLERQAGRCAPQVCVKGCERICNSGKVFGVARVDDVHVLGEARRSMEDGRDSTNDNEPDICSGKRL